MFTAACYIVLLIIDSIMSVKSNGFSKNLEILTHFQFINIIFCNTYKHLKIEPHNILCPSEKEIYSLNSNIFPVFSLL